MTSLFKIIAFVLLIKGFLIIYDFIMVVRITFFAAMHSNNKKAKFQSILDFYSTYNHKLTWSWPLA